LGPCDLVQQALRRLPAAAKWDAPSEYHSRKSVIVTFLRDGTLVGPRPLLMEYLPHYTAEQNRRHSVLPGITGWAQINGRNLASFSQRLKLGTLVCRSLEPVARPQDTGMHYNQSTS